MARQACRGQTNGWLVERVDRLRSRAELRGTIPVVPAADLGGTEILSPLVTFSYESKGARSPNPDTGWPARRAAHPFDGEPLRVSAADKGSGRCHGVGESLVDMRRARKVLNTD